MIPEILVRVLIRRVYKDAKTKTNDGTQIFEVIEVIFGLRKRSVLSTLLFAIVTYVITSETK